MTALDPACPENADEAPSPKWTSERVAFITEQYLIYRKSGGEIARMLGPALRAIPSPESSSERAP